MEPAHIFCKKLLADENNIFTVDISVKNEVEHVKSKKSTEYAVTGLSINHNIGSALVAVADIDRQNL